MDKVKGHKIDSKDPAVLQAMKILRLAQLHKLRDLQTCINECIVTMQQVTSDPKTDTTLGKVGHWLPIDIRVIELIYFENVYYL